MKTVDGKPRYYGKVAKVGLVWGFLREGTNFLLQLPTAMILARLLTPQEAGVAAAAYFFMQLCTRLTQFGFGVALVRAKAITGAHTSSVFLVNLVLATLAWAALTLGAPAIGSFFRSADTAAVLPTAALGFFIVAFASVPTALLSRDMRYRDSATSDWLANATAGATSIGLAWYGFSFWSLVYGHLAGDAVRALTRAAMARWVPSLRFSRPAMREMFSFGAGIYARNLLEYGVNNLDNLIVGRVVGITGLGFYDKAYSTMSRLTNKINLSGPSVSFRIFALIEGQPERFRRAYRKVILSVALVSYPVLTGMIVTGPELIEVLYGRQWLDAVVPFQILCVAAMLRILNTYASSATQAKGQIWSEVRRQAVFVVVLVAAVATLARWGIVGAAAGVLVATTVMTLMLQTLVRRLAGLNWRDMLEPHVPGLVCSLGLLAVVSLARRAAGAVLVEHHPLVVLATCAMIAAAYYAAFVLLVRFREVREVVHETVHDLAPGVAKRLPWLGPPASTKDVPAFSGGQ